MNELSEHQIAEAFQIWRGHGLKKNDDAALVPFLNSEIEAYSPKKRGWLRKAREGLMWSTGRVSQNLGISRQAYSRIENSEQAGSITIRTLAKVANAMDCELVYAIRPKAKRTFSVLLWEQLYPEAIKHNWVRSRPRHLKARALSAIAKLIMEDPQMRSRLNLSERRSSKDGKPH